jgi:hypothetical protein
MSDQVPEDERELLNENPPPENPYADGPGEQEDFGSVQLGDDPDVDFVEVEE